MLAFKWALRNDCKIFSKLRCKKVMRNRYDMETFQNFASFMFDAWGMYSHYLDNFLRKKLLKTFCWQFIIPLSLRFQDLVDGKCCYQPQRWLQCFHQRWRQTRHVEEDLADLLYWLFLFWSKVKTWNIKIWRYCACSHECLPLLF